MNGIQIMTGQDAQAMARGELESCNAIYHFCPSIVPKPVVVGPWHLYEDTHFILLPFIDMVSGIADFHRLPREVAKLHLVSSEDGNPEGFGFTTFTFHGNIPQPTAWTKTWEAYFSRILDTAIKLYENAVEPRNLSSAHVNSLLTKVIPRLLRPLRTETGELKPPLLYGDLWRGNFVLDRATLQPVIFDACSFWGYSECKQRLSETYFEIAF